MFEKLLLLLLKAKVAGSIGLQAPLIASLLVLSTTGFVVTGTISHAEDGEEETVNLIVKPLETKTCVDALIAQTETLFQLDALANDATRELRHLRGRAREQAEDQHRMLDEAALRAQFELSSGEILAELSAARQLVFAAAELGNCEDLNPDTTVLLVLADLRQTYEGIVRDLGRKLNDILRDAQTAFDELVAIAPLKPESPSNDSDSGDSGDSGDSDD